MTDYQEDFKMIFFTLLNRVYSTLTTPSYWRLPMTTSIVPNIALGMGVILIITFACGSIERIPCKNTATAKFIARSYNS